jgi:hypothetical protein
MLAEGRPNVSLERRTLAMFDFEIPTDFAALTDEQLSELDTQARTAAEPFVTRAQAGETLTGDDLRSLETLAGVVTNIRTQRDTRVAEAAVNAAGTTRSAAAVEAFATSATPTVEATTEPEVPAVETPPAEVAPTSSAPRVADVARGTPPPRVADNGAQQATAVMTAAPNLQGFTTGHVFANMEEVGLAAEQNFATFGQLGPNQRVKRPVMYLRRNFPDDLVIGKNDDQAAVERKLDYAGDEGRLEGGSLVAAAGWCAPSEIDYGLLELETTDGLLSLPEVQINRGGIQFTTGPDFSTIFGGAGYWHQTEAQVIAATTKPCMVISCPSFTEKRLEVEGVCITGAFLQDRGYPEMVARFTRGAMAAHVHKLNIFKINQIVAGSTLFDYTNVANLPITTTEFKDLTVASRLLSVMGIQAVDYRYKYRMARTATLEAFAPWWVVESVAADVQRRMGTTAEEAFDIAYEQINSWLAKRYIRCQWVYDWLDAYNTTNTSTVGQTAGVYTLPTTMEFILYAAGTWVAGVADVIRLDTVYDSTNLALNQYTQLWTEEGILVAKRGFESRRIKLTIDPSGTTSATTNMVQG